MAQSLTADNCIMEFIRKQQLNIFVRHPRALVNFISILPSSV